MTSCRAPEKSRPRPVSRLTAAPTANSATRLSARLTRRTAVPPPNRYGMTGTAAPSANATNDPTGRPDRRAELVGVEAELLANERVERGHGVPEDAVGDPRRLLGGEALRSVGGGQLGLLLLGHRLHLGPLERDLPLEELALALHRDVLAGGHAERAGEQSGDPGEQDEPRLGGVAPGHAHDERRGC